MEDRTIINDNNMLFTINVNDTTNTDVSKNNTVDDGDPFWVTLMDGSQLALTLIGVTANTGTSITLIKNKQIFSPIVHLMLIHQSMVDGAACFFATILFLQPFNWVPGVKILDDIVCHVWSSQLVYWYMILVSVWNLVVIASERYLAVCHPFKHSNFTRRTVILIFCLIYVMAALSISVLLLQTYMENGKCVSGYFIKGPVGDTIYKVYAYYAFLVFYAVPCACFFILYGMVAISMQRRKRDSNFESNRVIDTAARQLTKTAITVTAIFIVALGYDLWYYILAYSGVGEYVVNSILQKAGVWLAAFNSVANPFVYALLMPVYRKCVINTFFPCVNYRKEVLRDKTNTGENEASTSKSYVVSLPEP